MCTTFIINAMLKTSFKGLVIWFICALFYLYELLLRTIIGTFEPGIKDDLALDIVEFAFISSTIYQLVYCVMQIPVAVIMQRFGLKKTLSLASLACGVSIMLFAFSETFTGGIISRILMGFGASFGFIGVLFAVYEWLPKKYIAFFTGTSQFIGTLGPMFAAGPLREIATASQANWRHIFIIVSAFGILLSILIVLFVRNKRKKINSAEGAQLIPEMKSLRKNLIDFFSNKQMWFIVIFSASTYFIVEYFAENAGIPYVMLLGYSNNLAAYCITVSWLGFAISSSALGYISDRIKRRKSIIIFSIIIPIIGMYLLSYYPVNKFMLFIAFFFIGIGSSGQSIGFVAIMENIKPSQISLGIGFNNAMLLLLTALNGPLISWAMITMSHGAGSYNIPTYQSSFYIIFAYLFLALIVTIFGIKETFAKSVYEDDEDDE